MQQLLAETGLTYRQLAARTRLSAGYLNTSSTATAGARNEVIATLADALGIEPEHFLEYPRPRHHGEARGPPELVDRLYKRLG